MAAREEQSLDSPRCRSSSCLESAGLQSHFGGRFFLLRQMMVASCDIRFSSDG
jgi:hypothetical protein